MKRLAVIAVVLGTATVSHAQFVDFFNRADAPDLGTDWTLVVNDTKIVSNMVENGTGADGLSVVTGYSAPLLSAVAAVDAFAGQGDNNHVAVLIGYAGVGGAQTLYAKIWDSNGDGIFDLWGLQDGNDGGGLPGALITPTSAARIYVWAPTNDIMRMGIDHDMDGTIDETHDRTNMLIWGTNLGTGIGLGIQGSAKADNFMDSFDPVPEPASMVVLGLGAAALYRRRRKA